MSDRLTDNNTIPSLDPMRRRTLTRVLNDVMRKSCLGDRCSQARYTMTRGVSELLCDHGGPFGVVGATIALMRAVAIHDPTEADNPYGERDFGMFTFAGEQLAWKIDYYDKTLSHGSERPWDELETVRVLTVMRLDEW